VYAAMHNILNNICKFIVVDGLYLAVGVCVCVCVRLFSFAAVLRVHSEQWFPLQHNGGSVSVCCFRERASPP